MRLAWASFVLLVVSSICLAQSTDSSYYSVPAADAPELAARGRYAVGVRTVDLVHRGQIDILHFDKATGKAPLYDRPLKVEVWYPAVIPSGQQEETIYQMPVPGGHGFAGSPVLPVTGKALRDAAPVTGTRFPLVIVSHGYPGSRYFLTYLTENLASKGYVVAAIDHTDSVFDGVRGFESTLLNRSADQLFTIGSLDELSRQPDSFLHSLVDTSNVAIAGYSMGGYGALTSAGAGYSESSALMKFVPGGYLQDWAAGSSKFRALDRSRIKAIVAIAPWGEQPPYQAWDEQGLGGIRIPSLFIAGDHDDVADYTNGIKHDTIHPMERAPHDSQMEKGEVPGRGRRTCRRESGCLTPARPARGPRPASRARDRPRSPRGRAARSRGRAGPGPQPRSSTRCCEPRPVTSGDAADQRRRVRHPAALVVRRRGAVALRVQGCRPRSLRHRFP